MRNVVILALATGCSSLPEEVLLKGTVLDAPDGDPLGDATLTSYDEVGTQHADVRSGPDGTFELLAPAGDVVYVDVEASGVVASHTGVAGLQDTQKVEPGAIFAFPPDELEAWRATFAGCPAADGDGGIVLGEVRVIDLVDPNTGENPLVATAVVTVDDYAGTTWEACYLDADGLAWDPEAQWTGLAGQFAIFGVPAGQYRLTVSYEIGGSYWVDAEYPVRIPDGGVAPRFPAWVEFAL